MSASLQTGWEKLSLHLLVPIQIIPPGDGELVVAFAVYKARESRWMGKPGGRKMIMTKKKIEAKRK